MQTYLSRKRSMFNMSLVGMFLLSSFILGISITLLTSGFINVWLRILAFIVSTFFIFRLIQILRIAKRNKKIELCITEQGISYGDLFIDWREIKEIYPRGGFTIFGDRRYQLGYKLKKGIQTSNILPVDSAGIKHKEFVLLLASLKSDIQPKYPDLAIETL